MKWSGGRERCRRMLWKQSAPYSGNFHMEGLCGAFIQDSTSFPSGIGRGAGWNPKLEEKIAEIVSRQEAACGITHVFALCLIFPEIPEWDGREKRMERIRFLRPGWQWHLLKECRYGVLSENSGLRKAFCCPLRTGSITSFI